MFALLCGLVLVPLCTSLIHVPPGIEPRDVSEDAPAYRRVSTGWEDEWSPAAATDHVILEHGPLHKGFVGYEVSTGKVFSRRPKDTSPPVMNTASAHIVSSACEILKADGTGPMAWTAWEDVKLATVVQPWVVHVTTDTGWISKVHRLTLSGDHPTRWECECAVSEPENEFRTSPMRRLRHSGCSSSARTNAPAARRKCVELTRLLSGSEQHRNGLEFLAISGHRWANIVQRVADPDCQACLMAAMNELADHENVVNSAHADISEFPRPPKGSMLGTIKGVFEAVSNMRDMVMPMTKIAAEIANRECGNSEGVLPHPTVIPVEVAERQCGGTPHPSLFGMLQTPRVGATPENLNVTTIVSAAFDHLCDVVSCLSNLSHYVRGYSRCVASVLGGPEANVRLRAKEDALLQAVAGAGSSPLVLGGGTRGGVCDMATDLRNPAAHRTQSTSLDRRADDAIQALPATISSMVARSLSMLAASEVAVLEWRRAHTLEKQARKKGGAWAQLGLNTSEDTCCCAREFFAFDVHDLCVPVDHRRQLRRNLATSKQRTASKGARSKRRWW